MALFYFSAHVFFLINGKINIKKQTKAGRKLLYVFWRCKRFLDSEVCKELTCIVVEEDNPPASIDLRRRYWMESLRLWLWLSFVKMLPKIVSIKLKTLWRLLKILVREAFFYRYRSRWEVVWKWSVNINFKIVNYNELWHKIILFWQRCNYCLYKLQYK